MISEALLKPYPQLLSARIVHQRSLSHKWTLRLPRLCLVPLQFAPRGETTIPRGSRTSIRGTPRDITPSHAKPATPIRRRKQEPRSSVSYSETLLFTIFVSVCPPGDGPLRSCSCRPFYFLPPFSTFPPPTPRTAFFCAPPPHAACNLLQTIFIFTMKLSDRFEQMEAKRVNVKPGVDVDPRPKTYAGHRNTSIFPSLDGTRLARFQ